MDGKVVQLVQGRKKALEGDAPLEMLRKFQAFPEIQVIDLDACDGDAGENSALVELLASRSKMPHRRRRGRTPDDARSWSLDQGAHRSDRRHGGFHPGHREISRRRSDERILIALGSKQRQDRLVKGWQETTDLHR